MTYAHRLQRWNRWYDHAPEELRFQLVIWGLIAVGAINMLLTIAVGFPFALLLVLAIIAVAAVRVPHRLGWVQGGEAEGGDAPRMAIAAPGWVHDVNRWYDGLSEFTRPFVILAALVIPGAINMALTIANGFPFGLLFLLALLVLLAIRAPYAAGWYTQPGSGAVPSLALTPRAPQLGSDAGPSSPSPPPHRTEPAAVEARDASSPSGPA